MAFMERQITLRRRWLEIDGSVGVTAVDAADAPELLAAYERWHAADSDHGSDDLEQEMLAAAETYYEGDPESVTLRTGFGARLSAPGYLDCTEWTVFDTEAAARLYLDALEDEG